MRCAILPILSLLATLDMIPVLKKLPLKRVFGYAWHTQSVKESFQVLTACTEWLKRVFPICQPHDLAIKCGMCNFTDFVTFSNA